MINFFSNHIYFLGTISFLLIWVLFWVSFKEGRKKILIMSCIGMLLGALFGPLTLGDWWHPNFLFDTFIKIEDVMFGFTISGIISAIFGIICSHFKISTTLDITIRTRIFITILCPLLFFLFFYVFGMSSFWASVIQTLIGVIIICSYKAKTIIPVIATGILFLIIIFPGYMLGNYLDPTWIANQWWIDKLSGITVLSIPVEEFIWCFIAGIGIPPLQMLWIK